MTRTISLITLLIAVLSFGCTIAQVDHSESTIPFGTSVSHAVEAQKLNPLPAGTEPVTGADGEYALKVLDKYQEGPKTSTKEGESLFLQFLGGVGN